MWRFRVARQSNAWAIVEQQSIFETPSGGGNHWGGDLKFGPDGYLYISLGDGGNGMTPSDAQKTSWLRGKILRIDPRGRTDYAIPPTNPFASETSKCGGLDRTTLEARTAPCPEIFAIGFRNPWRMSFDRATQRLWVGDVGSGKEEVDLVVNGKNYGWNTCDGINPTSGCPPTTNTSGFIAPVAQYRVGSEVSVTGGYVYRGSALGTSLQGAYIFSDVYSGNIFVIDQPYANVTPSPFAVTNTYEHPTNGSTLPKFRVIPQLAAPLLVSFAEDENAELYAVTFSDVKGQGVLKLVPQSAPPADTIPMLLSQTGCVDPADPKQPAPGMIPYDLNAPFWSDGAEKTRWLAIPDGTTIRIGADGDWELPIGSVLMKRFRVAGKLVETRLLVRHTDGGWAGYTWVWRDDESDAVRANPEGEQRLVGTQTWSYPSRAGCMSCHTMKAGSSLGLETRQLNREIVYPSTGRRSNQIDTLAHIGLFDTAPAVASTLPAFIAPLGNGDIETRARTSLHTNCAQCHRDDMRPSLHFDTSLAMSGLCNPSAPLVVPGSPATSPIISRMRDPDPTMRMPKGGGSIIDEMGVQLIEEWIRGMTSCP